jgi:ATP-dependent 26S proteasome regulatory subunit
MIVRLYDKFVNGEKWEKEGAALPLGVLLVGPPGSGKTLLASALSKATNAKFFETRGSSFVNKFVGQGPAAVRAFFRKGREYISEKKGNKAVLFIDEIDGFGNREQESNMEYNNTLIEFIAQMDGFDKKANHGLVVMGATNFKEKLDDAILSRFEEKIEIPSPNKENRESVLKYYLDQVRKEKLDPSLSISYLAQITEGFSNRDLYHLFKKCNDDRIQNETHLMQEHFIKRIQEKKEEMDLANMRKKIHYSRNKH